MTSRRQQSLERRGEDRVGLQCRAFHARFHEGGDNDETPDMAQEARYTVEQLQAAALRLPRFPLAHLPTPLELADRFSRAVGGPRIYLKRDDCTGLCFGGNKARHNEYLIADALAQRAELLVWGAGVQSNNCRQTAAACAKAGLGIHLVLGRGDGAPTGEIQGNLLLDHLVGAVVEVVDEPVGPALDDRIKARADEYRARGRRVYAWDRDRLKPLAAVSYLLCVTETAAQAERLGIRPTAIYVCSSGSTGAGTALAAKALGLSIPVRNIAPIEWPWDTRADMARIANQAAALLKLDLRLAHEEIDVDFGYIAPGYGRASAAGLEAIALLARTEGILLDTVYSGKAMAALIDHARRGLLTSDDTVVFIHTGGAPALFAEWRELVRGIPARTQAELDANRP